MLGQFLVGEAQDRETATFEFAIANTVGTEGGAVGVVAVAVGLDDQALSSPKKVDRVRTDPDVDLWLGDSVLSADPEEKTLQVAASPVGRVAEVAHGAVVGGDGDVSAEGPVREGERGRTMKGDPAAALAAAMPGDRDVDDRRAPR